MYAVLTPTDTGEHIMSITLDHIAAISEDVARDDATATVDRLSRKILRAVHDDELDFGPVSDPYDY
jgi:hypothetical protein